MSWEKDIWGDLCVSSQIWHRIGQENHNGFPAKKAGYETGEFDLKSKRRDVGLPLAYLLYWKEKEALGLEGLPAGVGVWYKAMGERK